MTSISVYDTIPIIGSLLIGGAIIACAKRSAAENAEKEGWQAGYESMCQEITQSTIKKIQSIRKGEDKVS